MKRYMTLTTTGHSFFSPLSFPQQQPNNKILLFPQQQSSSFLKQNMIDRISGPYKPCLSCGGDMKDGRTSWQQTK